MRNLVKKYENHVAVDHLGVTIEKGKSMDFYAFSNAGVPLCTLYMEKTTLEDIFLELTQGHSFRLTKERK